MIYSDNFVKSVCQWICLFPPSIASLCFIWSYSYNLFSLSSEIENSYV